MVFALLNSFWQCQKTDEKIGSKKVFHGGLLTEGVGLQQFGQCPYGNKTFEKGASLQKSFNTEYTITKSDNQTLAMVILSQSFHPKTFKFVSR